MNGIHVEPAAIERHRVAPLHEERERFLLFRKAQGTNWRNLTSLAATLLHVIRLLDLVELRQVTIAEIEKAGDVWAADDGHHAHGLKRGKPSKVRFVWAAKLFFGFHGALDLQILVPPFHAELTRYLHVFTEQRGLASTTTTTYRNQLLMFLKWIGSRRGSLSEVTVADVTDYLNVKRRTCCARSIFTTAQPLKSFFAYGETQGWFIPGLGSVLCFPNRVRYDPDAVFPSWEDVRRILDEDVGKGAGDLRNRAMLLLCSVYGFRSSEVAGLRLGDIDWREETLTLTRSKNGRTQQFPLQYEVGEAILEYLIHGRPQCSCRNLFIRQHRPYRPVKPTVLNTVTAKRMAQLQIKSSKSGPHALRHACATQLLRTGSSLRQIADFLGHKGLTSVSIYARLDTEAMREVAAFSLKGVL